MPNEIQIRPPGVFSLGPGDEYRDWRTLDPSLIGAEVVQVEELRTYCERIEEILAEDAGRGLYVLIVGPEIIRFFTDLDQAVSYAKQAYAGRQLLIKKVVALEPIHNLGGATLPTSVESFSG